MISAIIFTKNRASQLQLLLRSIKDNFTELKDVFILVKATNDKYSQAYEKVNSQFTKFNWMKEENFKSDTLSIMEDIKSKYVLIFADDEVVINDYSIYDSLKLFDNVPNLHSISLKHHLYLTYTYTANVDSPPPEFEKIDNLYIWNWKNCNHVGEWGYPSSINSTIYSKIFLEHYMNKIDFNNLNQLEGRLNTNRNNFKSKMACFEYSKTVCIANNIVQSGTNRFNNNPNYHPESLNNKFLNGFQISSNNIYRLRNNMCTFEVDYEFERMK